MKKCKEAKLHNYLMISNKEFKRHKINKKIHALYIQLEVIVQFILDIFFYLKKQNYFLKKIQIFR